MIDLKRRSPVVFPEKAKQVEVQDHWTVATEYEGEGQGPWIVDLSHRPRWDIQNNALSDLKPLDFAIPDTPGQCRLEKGVLINRMNRTQASFWQLTGERFEMPDDAAFTDTTDGTLFLAMVGREVPLVAEKLSALDFLDPTTTSPRLFQGPFAH
ncbi:MAG: sarcosine oxidase subunit gamma SoxG, partial [Deltaproteobacteria bacterium]|nr:sarcosine oxidase subunit gamma SoxG [Deltaproteobacteria bacterium]